MDTVVTLEKGKRIKRDGTYYALAEAFAVPVVEIDAPEVAPTRLLKGVCDNPKHRPRRITFKGCEEFRTIHPKLIRTVDSREIPTPQGYTGDLCMRCASENAANPYVRLSDEERAKLGLEPDTYLSAEATEVN